MKPIEPGCKALVISGNDAGAVVLVLDRPKAGADPRLLAGRANSRALKHPSWIVQSLSGRPMTVKVYANGTTTVAKHTIAIKRDRRLRRLDDDQTLDSVPTVVAQLIDDLARRVLPAPVPSTKEMPATNLAE
jgi:hypothetical protein